MNRSEQAKPAAAHLHCADTPALFSIQNNDLGIKLPLHLKQMGAPEHCGHRSGWRHVMDHLRQCQRPAGMLLDDFVERTFQHPGSTQEWHEPWIGIFHHPRHVPHWYDPSAVPSVIFQKTTFRNSLKHLAGAVTLSTTLGDWLAKELVVPVKVLKHPTEIPDQQFSINQWEQQATKTIVQVGWYCRNSRAIYQLRVPDDYKKVHLLQDRPWVHNALQRIDNLSPTRHRPLIGDVQVIEPLDNPSYDSLLAHNLVFCEYLDVSASNTVIEAIARNTPIVVNRHPALEEYLGIDYPLFYEHLDEVAALLTQPGLIRSAYHYLGALDKSWLSAETFTRQLMTFVNQIGTGTTK
ncbi:hypothetical protein SAMN03159512_04946 [Pseudomonas sp. NFR09]|uniref:hypothetical protein n=2 Tax=unclassified Pseudomonas TaxID=196821 RepID=UPI0008D12810|nr:hypothetical protein [Pseudomonas sp. NFR09]SEU08108.1 hypothetical protein SAMN03159512_04946 [Pseudomonas sp. NFR09]SFB05342.1 hypothetical protein SAMN03159485_02438 [Pseudomonas sp. NFPP24]